VEAYHFTFLASRNNSSLIRGLFEPNLVCIIKHIIQDNACCTMHITTSNEVQHGSGRHLEFSLKRLISRMFKGIRSKCCTQIKISIRIILKCHFWATVCKTVRPMLSDCCLSVCNVGVLWPNGWMDQDETWHGGRPQLWPHCVRWGPSCPPPAKRGTSVPHFSADVHCGQMAGWIEMPLGMKVGLSPGDIVLDGDPAPLKRGHSPSPQFSAHV